MTVGGISKYKRSAIRDSVADAVRRTLLAGEFPPGEIISEATFADAYGISRGPVREALLTLASEGLLAHQPNRGFAVLEFTPEDLRHIEIVRLALEPLALAASRNNAGRDDVAQLRDIKTELVRAFSAKSQFECVSAEVQFHESVWTLSRNPWLSASLRRVALPGFTYGAALSMTRPELTAETMDRIHAIYIDYIEGSDAISAEDCVRLHLSAGGR